MLIIIQLPIFDFRRFSETSHFLKVPLWPSPIEGEFVRNVGKVTYRKRGGLNNWIGEFKICTARKSIRFVDSPIKKISSIGKNKPLLIKPAFRRFYFDGLATGKYELGFSLKSKEGIQLKLSDIKKSVRELLNCKVAIPVVKHPKEHAFLGVAGKKLAFQYLNSTSHLKTTFEQRFKSD